MLIDCDRCAMRDIACSDCVVTMLLDGPANAAGAGGPELDDDEVRAVEALSEAGLVAPLRLVPLLPADGRKPTKRRSIA